LRRFVEEAQVCGQLQHPGIVPVHDLGRLEDGRPFFAMKLVKGRTLAELLRERAGPDDDLPRLLGIFEQVCQAVAYAHSKGVIHRDLKSANVMVGAFGEVQLMDWGLAKVLRPPEGRRRGTRPPSAWSSRCAAPRGTSRATAWRWARRRTWPRSRPAARSGGWTSAATCSARGRPA
jgi:serine/threonine protein kinase